MKGRTTFLLAVVCGAAVGGVYAGQPVLGRMGHDLGISLDADGWLISAAQLGYLVGLIVLVPLGDLLDRKRLIAIHLGVVSVGLAVTASAPAPVVAFIGLVVVGLFAVVVQTTIAYTATASDDDRRGRNLGVVTSGVVVGILGARIGAGFLAELWGWRSIYIAFAILTALLVPLVLLFIPAESVRERRRYSEVMGSFARRFTEPLFLSRGAIAFFLFASFGTLWSGMSLPLSAAPWHLTQAQIGLFGVAGLAGALGAARSGRWGDAGHAQRVTGLALAVLLVSWVAIGQLPWSLIILVAGVVALDFAVQAVHVSNQHILTTAHSDSTSGTIGAYMVFYSLGSALGAATTTAVYERLGWTASAVLGAGYAVGGLTVWTLARRLQPGETVAHERERRASKSR